MQALDTYKLQEGQRKKGKKQLQISNKQNPFQYTQFKSNSDNS